MCIQHEMDHLKGKVFVEYLSRLKQNRILAKMQEAGEAAAAGVVVADAMRWSSPALPRLLRPPCALCWMPATTWRWC